MFASSRLRRASSRERGESTVQARAQVEPTAGGARQRVYADTVPVV
ncbi:MAG: hypothetical protein NZ585_01865 [Chloracidobacterium sp.]|nr:hypothetical protein [Chloracidobacterium sp.]MDW8216019.1 hypothetical protein [Acidobacteriota bacterium]